MGIFGWRKIGKCLDGIEVKRTLTPEKEGSTMSKCENNFHFMSNTYLSLGRVVCFGGEFIEDVDVMVVGFMEAQFVVSHIKDEDEDYLKQDGESGARDPSFERFNLDSECKEWDALDDLFLRISWLEMLPIVNGMIVRQIMILQLLASALQMLDDLFFLCWTDTMYPAHLVVAEYTGIDHCFSREKKRRRDGSLAAKEMRSNEQHDNNHGSPLVKVLFTLQSNPYKSQSHMLEEFTNWDLRAQAIALETIGPIKRARSLKDFLSFGMVTEGRFGKDCGGDDDLFGGDSNGQCPCCPNMVVLKVTRRFRGSGRQATDVFGRNLNVLPPP
ncbi:hypothetical protein Ancab_006017 [Ancistrocladus abbreviatus]